ncbi:uncharacterized protein EI90DRAFT_3011662 [Cantharellus anzutake]|uniref:uncharacterized protein n=1 Tax=Cantharellus anzutake TaxID=1750568 RepID=UPI0019032FE9|nr:uncharacterized protein EI90DRAFT_3011662 [Cantharellus anzutake]KAF8342119.1 hypothetical protein EI90DRAFT_3011662 [Cantharellus anzutake]
MFASSVDPAPNVRDTSPPSRTPPRILSCFSPNKLMKRRDCTRPSQPEVHPTALSIKAVLSGSKPAIHSSSSQDSSRNRKVWRYLYRPKPKQSDSSKSRATLYRELLDETAANTVIASLKSLPPPVHHRITPKPASTTGDTTAPFSASPVNLVSKPPNPQPAAITSTAVHAVCLEYNDEDANNKIFSLWKPSDDGAAVNSSSTPPSSGSILSSLSRIRLVNPLSRGSVPTPPIIPLSRIAIPGFGPRASVKEYVEPHIISPQSILFNNVGLDATLMGAIPSPKTIVDGMNDVSAQLLAMGLGGPLDPPGDVALQGLLPNHKGIYPPTDRLSVITYWWGYELVLPEPTIQYLSVAFNGRRRVPRAESIANVIIYILTCLAFAVGGVREILPFIKYIAQFVDSEWDFIKSKDQGKGVVCAATWVVPIALVPRPWDFPDPPNPSKPPAASAGPSSSNDQPLPPIPYKTQGLVRGT